MCNYFNLITGEDRHTFLAFDWKTSKDYKATTAGASERFSLTFVIFVLGSFLLRFI